MELTHYLSAILRQRLKVSDAIEIIDAARYTMSVDTTFVSQENFWSKMTRLKYDICYYERYFARCVLISRILTGITVGGTSIATLLWMEYHEIAAFAQWCPYVILALQIMSVFKDHFPYDGRKNALRELTDELVPIYEDMEADWQMISIGSYEEEEIISKATSYAKEIEKIRKHYFKDDALPEIEKLIQKSDEEVDRYYTNKGWR